MTKKTDFNSLTNQEIKSKFVQREVLACFSYEMDSILKASSEGVKSDLPTFDDIENLYSYHCPNCGEDTGTNDLKDLYDDEGSYKCTSCKASEIERLWDSELQEVYEWWIVSKFLYKKLKAKGHPVLEWGNNYYWGRCTTGQAILFDGVISDICSEMGILEGQQYDWSK